MPRPIKVYLSSHLGFCCLKYNQLIYLINKIKTKNESLTKSSTQLNSKPQSVSATPVNVASVFIGLPTNNDKQKPTAQQPPTVPKVISYSKIISSTKPVIAQTVPRTALPTTRQTPPTQSS